MLRFRTWQGLLIGLGIGIAGSIFLPRVRARIQKNMLLSGVTDIVADSAAKVQNNVKKWSDAIKEEAQDLVAEAQYERMRREIDKEIMDGASHDDDERLPLS